MYYGVAGISKYWYWALIWRDLTTVIPLLSMVSVSTASLLHGLLPTTNSNNKGDDERQPTSVHHIFLLFFLFN